MSKTDPAPVPPRRFPRPVTDPSQERCFNGIPVSPGIAIGPVFGTSEPTADITRFKIHAEDIAAEGARLETAIAQSRKQLGKLRVRLTVLPEESQAEIAPLIDAYVRMLGPSRLVRGVKRRIEETLLSAEHAVATEAEAIAKAIVATADGSHTAEDKASVRRQAEEIREIGRRLVRNLKARSRGMRARWCAARLRATSAPSGS